MMINDSDAKQCPKGWNDIVRCDQKKEKEISLMLVRDMSLRRLFRFSCRLLCFVRRWSRGWRCRLYCTVEGLRAEMDEGKGK